MFRKWFSRTEKAHRAASRPHNAHLIDLHQVEKTYQSAAGSFTALKRVDLQIDRGEFVAIIGKSGSGKSTLINMISGIDRPSAGKVLVGDTAVDMLSESQMASAVSQAQQVQQAHHHHHHKSGRANEQADNTANALLQALDGNDDGSVSEDEFSSFITANGGTAANASSDFAALNTSGSNALTSADFAKAFNAYQTQQNTQSPGSMVVSLLNQLAGASGATSISA